MTKSREKKQEALRKLRADAERMMKEMKGIFANSDEEALALIRLRDLIESYDHSIALHGMKDTERTAHEVQGSRGQVTRLKENKPR